jgi:hypothetical protein
MVDVHVNILNQNEYAPEFLQAFYSFAINENITNTSMRCFGQVKAIDGDYGDQIEYLLENYLDLFSINQRGQICTETIFDREINDEYNVTVIARDNSSIGSIGSTLVRVHVRYAFRK